jgi:hypothetical protein
MKKKLLKMLPIIALAGIGLQPANSVAGGSTDKYVILFRHSPVHLIEPSMVNTVIMVIGREVPGADNKVKPVTGFGIIPRGMSSQTKAQQV